MGHPVGALRHTCRMLIVIDSNAAIGNVLTDSWSWQTLLYVRQAWGVQVSIPEVVVRETVGERVRVAEEAIVAFDGHAAKKNHDLFGTEDIRADYVETIRSAAALTDQTLREKLHQSEVGIDPIPPIEHAVLIDRAVTRTRPCKPSTGDGYRDTLIWLGLIEKLKASEDDLIFVTADSDFCDDTGDQLNEDLEAELKFEGLQGRVTVHKSIHELVAKLIDDNSLDVTPNDLLVTMQKAHVWKFVEEELLPTVVLHTVRPRELALPRAIDLVDVIDVENLRDTTVNIKANVDGTQALVEFSATVHAHLSMTFGEGEIPDDFEGSLWPGESDVWTHSKDVEITGFVRIDTVAGKAIDGEISTITAARDDPGRSAWRNRSVNSVKAEMRIGMAAAKLLAGTNGFASAVELAGLKSNLTSGLLKPYMASLAGTNTAASLIAKEAMKNRVQTNLMFANIARSRSLGIFPVTPAADWLRPSGTGISMPAKSRKERAIDAADTAESLDDRRDEDSAKS